MANFMTKSWKKLQFSQTEKTKTRINKRQMRLHLLAAVFFLITGIILSGCTKPEEELGIGLQPEDDLLYANVVDTFTIRAYTVLDDSVRTDNLSPAIVGAFIDPVFGFTKAGHVTQLRLTSNNPNLVPDGSSIDNIVVDSVILSLDFYRQRMPDPLVKNIYGNPGQQYFEVFEIANEISVDSIYYENSPIEIDGIDLIKSGFNLQTPNPNDSIIIGDEKIPAQIRIPLREDFAERFFVASENGKLNSTEFQSLIKGIYITVDETKFNPAEAGLISFDTFQGDSKITLYYRNVLPDSTQFLNYSFAIRSNAAKFQKFSHDYTTAHPNLVQQLDGNVESGKKDLFIQGNSGTKIKMDFPFIESLKERNDIAINHAKIILPVRDEDLEKFPPPKQLIIFALNANGKIYSLQYDEPLKHGFYNAEQKRYEFVITRYLQQVLTSNREHFGFEIVSLASGSSSNRVVLNGVDYIDSQDALRNLKLEVTLTKF